MSDLRHRTVETNGIRMRVAEQGAGPLVLLCHGFPESWYSWRHQLDGARGRGLSRGRARTCAATAGPTSPPRSTSTRCSTWSATWSGLLDALGERAGGDRGPRLGRARRLARRAAAAGPLPRGDRAQRAVPAARLVRPLHRDAADRRRDLLPALLPGPGRGRGGARAGRARAASAACSTRARARAGRRASGSAIPPRSAWCLAAAAFSSHTAEPAALPSWLTEADVDFYAGEFGRAGFRGGLNWYRNIDRNWELLAPYAGARVTVPALYVAGDQDLVVHFRGMDQLLPNLQNSSPSSGRRSCCPAAGTGRSRSGRRKSTTR